MAEVEGAGHVYRALVEGSPEAVLRIDGAGVLVFMNAEAERLFGYPREELLGSHFGVLLPKRFRDELAGAIAGLSAAGDICRLGPGQAVSGLHRDGTEFPIEVSAAHLGSGPAPDVIVNVRDVSERRHTENQLRDTLSLLAATLESTADGILVVTSDGTIAGLNEQFGKLWGIPPELLNSHDDGQVMAFVLNQLSDPGSFLDKVQELYSDPGAESLDILDFKDGRTFERYSRPQRVGSDIVGRVWSFRDVTARRRAEDQARAAITQLKGLGAIVNSSADAIVGMTPDGVITSWNAGAEKLYGYTAEEASGRNARFLIPEPLRAEEEELLAGVRRFGTPKSFEAERVRKDGSIVPVSVTISPIRTEGGAVTGVAKIVRDITSQRHAAAELLAAREAALESSRLKSEFLATMSHEIRTPMNGVIGLTALLLDTPLDETQRRYAEGVRGAGESLLALINDILDFSKLEAGKVELDVGPFDPRGLVEEVAGLLSEAARGKGLELIAYCQPELPARLSGDQGRIRQILLNLASNAVKFTSTGEVSIHAETTGKCEGGRCLVRFEVRDTGIGVAPEDHDRLFESFSQGDSSTTRRYGGTGLGLAISRRLTEAMEGEIGLESVQGEGSTFWFEIPLEQADDDGGDGLSAGATLAGLRVLVVDDNATNRLVLESQLRSWKMAPDSAGSARDALDRCAEARSAGMPFDVVVLDLCMPEVSGLDLARMITADPGLSGTSLIMLSSDPQVDPADLAAAGVGEWLTKPVRSSEFYNRLVRLRAGSAPRVPERPSPVPEPAGKAARGRVLVVEDNTVNQLVAREMVGKLGYDVDVVSDGREAVAAVAAGSYAAVLMDCHMPVMDGYAATRTIRGAGEADGLPIIAMTAGAMDEDRERCLAAGMDDFLTKPVDLAALEAALERWVALPPSDAAEPPGPAVPDPVVLDPAVPPALDEARLTVLRQLGPQDGLGLLPAAAEAFLDDVPSTLKELRHAMTTTPDRAAVRIVAHKLRGSAGNIGAAVAASLCAELEATGGGTEGLELLDRLGAELDRVDAALRRALAGEA
ncbi:PAS domain S-box protein [Arthrobacter sp. BPSS-3]|uniref:PAS domain S-box protein n=1 Tax=Arthrobacter sp. BPSS-3 TaxID=3366580 RepID=UPI0037DCBB70